MDSSHYKLAGRWIEQPYASAHQRRAEPPLPEVKTRARLSSISWPAAIGDRAMYFDSHLFKRRGIGMRRKLHGFALVLGLLSPVSAAATPDDMLDVYDEVFWYQPNACLFHAHRRR